MAQTPIPKAAPQETAAAETKLADSRSPASTVQQTFSSSNGNTVQSAQCSNQKGLPTHVRRNGGPRSRLGKARSRRNALKHGLCAKAVLLEGESSAEFAALLKGYRNYWRPVETPEEEAVTGLAYTAWCLRRLPPAERAEIELERKIGEGICSRSRST